MIQLRRVMALLLLTLTVGGCARYSGSARDVTIVSRDGVQLSGSLVFPRGTTARVPGVVLLHGAERATRSLAYRMHANIFLERGMAVLLYDKRGAGRSGGDHASATYADFIEDAVAAVALLRQRQEIDAARVGLVGASESGWLTPEITERAGDIAFVINKSGPSLSWRETVAWETYNEMLEDKVSESDARKQAGVLQRLWAYYIAPNPDERKALEAILAQWADRDASRLPGELRPVSAAYVQDISYDPAPFLERLTTPTLYVYGSEDVVVPTARCVARLTELRKASRPVSFRIFDGEGHELGGVGLRGYGFVEGYSELLGSFAERHTR